jgi:hypothetical protein
MLTAPFRQNPDRVASSSGYPSRPALVLELHEHGLVLQIDVHPPQPRSLTWDCLVNGTV